MHMIRIASARALRGFTLVELMVTIIVAAILTAIAVPNFRNLILSNRLTTTANEVVDALNTARMEAVKLNAQVQFCSDLASKNGSDTLGQTCGSTNSTAIWMMQTGTTQPLQVRTGVPGLVQQASTDIQLGNGSGGAINAVRYTGLGLGYTPGSSVPISAATIVDLCTSKLSSDNHRVITITAGSVIATTTTTGACP
jgi:type IV fimbrial biogenesis protein FimT